MFRQILHDWWERRCLVRDCRTHLRRLELEVGIPRPFSAEALRQRLEACLGKAIWVEQMPWDIEGIDGFTYMEKETGEYVALFNPSLPDPEHTILHELCHVVRGHVKEEDALSEEELRLIEQNPELARRFLLCRGMYEDPEDIEAEMLALLIEATAWSTEENGRVGRVAMDGDEALKLGLRTRR